LRPGEEIKKEAQRVAEIWEKKVNGGGRKAGKEMVMAKKQVFLAVVLQ